jgi:hypothetical protein
MKVRKDIIAKYCICQDITLKNSVLVPKKFSLFLASKVLELKRR